jgi:hypothetical protein
MRKLAIITITYPHGGSVVDNRPGHTLDGLLFYQDPFQRNVRVRLAHVAMYLGVAS